MKRRSFDWVVTVAALLLIASCSGGGCGGCAGFAPIPGGFPANQRARNAVQVRVTDTALTKLASDPAQLVSGILNGPLAFNIPASCGGSPEVCCPGGNPQAVCGPLNIDLAKQPGDDARLILAPIQGQRQLLVTMRARLKTTADIPIKYSGISCGVAIDTAPGDHKDVEVVAPVNFEQDATTGTTRIVVGDVAINRLDNDDLELHGSFACTLADFGVGFFLGTLKSTFADQIKSAVQDQTCKACASGEVAECGSFATACTNNVCMEGTQCLQELGISGRLSGSALFGSLSPGTTGSIDLYEVAGGYADSNTNGLALGLLGGMVPSGAPRDRCGPPATAPALATIQTSAFFQGNTRPDTGAHFDVGIGIHTSQLAQFAYSAYDGGLLCLTIGARTAAQLNSGTLVLLAGSLANLTETTAPMAVGLRPQRPPVITLGKNTFADDGAGGMKVVDPLLTVAFSGLELDFFEQIDRQYIRVFTVVTDLSLPIGLQTTAAGELQPVLGALDTAFSNISVTHSEAITEAPEQIATALPDLLPVVLPALAGSLGSIALPSFAGMSLAVRGVTSVPQTVGGTDNSYLAIYADLVPAAMAREVETTAHVTTTRLPTADVAADPTRWRADGGPGVTLALGGTGSDLEWSYRVDEGFWSAWSNRPTQTVRGGALWLGVNHVIEVRARQHDLPESIDPTPVRIPVEMTTAVMTPGEQAAAKVPFHGAPGEGGCACDSSGGNPTGSALFALLLGALLFGRRAVRGLVQMRRRIGTAMTAAVLAMLPGCSCGSDTNVTPPCGDVECKPGELKHGGYGRYTSIASDADRVLVATYDQDLGDLVVVDTTDEADVSTKVIDGVPPNVAPTYDPATYRGGIEGAGPDVGAWTSIAVAGGRGRVAYQDRDAAVLKFAIESDDFSWTSYVVDAEGETGAYASLALDSTGHPAIAYLAERVDNGAGQFVTELRLARASSATPGENDWSTSVVASDAGTCAGLCAAGSACIAGMTGETCAAVTSDCSAACGDGEFCVAGACTAEITDPMLESIGTGTGLFASLVVLPDGRLAVAYYHPAARALVLAVESAAGSNEFAETVLHGGTTGDRGLWASAFVDPTGLVHVAYQDAITDELLYTTWDSATGTVGVPEVVDDGVRDNDRTHPVGAGAKLVYNNGTSVIIYQDGLTADLMFASKSTGGWFHSALSETPLLDGFSIGVSVDAKHGVIFAWDQLNPALTPPNTLQYQFPHL